jgi:predicted DNA-binding transcriptional regulator YafY
MERSQRIARINVLLRQRQGVTMAQLMADLEVTRATINRDLDLMRDQMHAPIVWDRDRRVYHLAAENHAGPAYMLPGLWFTPQQAYAFLTMQNMVEKIAPNLLGPFLQPMRVLLKEMLVHADFQLHGLDRKIEINMPALPTLRDLDFTCLLDALVHDQAVCLVLAERDGTTTRLIGKPLKLRITPHEWRIDLALTPVEPPMQIDVGLIQSVEALTGCHNA